MQRNEKNVPGSRLPQIYKRKHYSHPSSNRIQTWPPVTLTRAVDICPRLDIEICSFETHARSPLSWQIMYCTGCTSSVHLVTCDLFAWYSTVVDLYTSGFRLKLDGKLNYRLVVWGIYQQRN